MATAKKPTTKRKVSKKKAAPKRPGTQQERKDHKRRRKHGVETRAIRRAAIKVLDIAMSQVHDINKSGLYALGVMKTKPPESAFVAQQEANDIVEEIMFQHQRIIHYLKTNIHR